MDVDTDKLDLYSIPVFILEVIILIGLAYSAHFIHFQYKHEPYLSGFYCDDISLRNEYTESKLTQQFTQPDNEIVVLALLLAVPIIVVCTDRESWLRGTLYLSLSTSTSLPQPRQLD